MNILLDTHSFIWFCENDSALPEKSKVLIEDPNNKIYISIVSFWEMAIKISLEKLKLKKQLSIVMENTVEQGIEILSISTDHILKVMNLAYHHRDPFDRFIISQALVENFAVCTVDSVFHKYGIEQIWS